MGRGIGVAVLDSALEVDPVELLCTGDLADVVELVTAIDFATVADPFPALDSRLSLLMDL